MPSYLVYHSLIKPLLEACSNAFAARLSVNVNTYIIRSKSGEGAVVDWGMLIIIRNLDSTNGALRRIDVSRVV